MNLQPTRHRWFWILQKWSSYTVWAHYAQQFDIFVKAYEEAQATWPKGERPAAGNIRLAYAAQALYQRGLAALARGDRSVWRQHDDAYLLEAKSAAFDAMSIIDSEEINNEFQGDHGMPLYPVWTSRLARLYQLKVAATPEGAGLVFEQRPRYMDWLPEALIGEEDLRQYFEDPHFGGRFQPWPLTPPPTPDPSRILVESGDRVPMDGIWELAQPHRAPGETDALNYFVKGAIVPWVEDARYDYQPGKQHALPATWRLVWEDARYLDGVIPDESCFLNPNLALSWGKNLP